MSNSTNLNGYFPHNEGESDIIGLLQRDDKKGVVLAFRDYHIALFYFAMQFTGDARWCQRVVRDCFVRLWKKRADFPGPSAISIFLYNEIQDACRVRAKETDRQYIPGAKTPREENIFIEQTRIKAELVQRIWQNIGEMPHLRQEIVKMTCFEGLNVFEIAAALGVTIDTVRVQKAKAIHTIRVFVKEKL